MTATKGDVDGACHMQLSCAANSSDHQKKLVTKRTELFKVKSGDNLQRRHHKRLALLLTKPSYTLKLCSKNIRHESRVKLQSLLRKLVRQQNWVEASGVLSILLKATSKEGSLQNNRTKYWVAMELLRHVESDAAVYSKQIETVYRTWMGKIHSWKNRPLKDKYAKLESILSVLAHNKTPMLNVVPTVAGELRSQEVLRHTPDELTLLKRLNNIREDARSLTLEHGCANDPASNLVIGLTFYEIWYSTLPKEMQLKNLDELFMPTDMETVGYNSCEKVQDMERCHAASVNETHADFYHHSGTSVDSDEDSNCNFCCYLSREATRGNNDMLVVHHQQFLTQGFCANSIHNAENDGPFEDHYDKMQVSSIFDFQCLQSLLPVRFPSSEDMWDLLYRISNDDTYKTALKHLKLAFESPPPVSEAALLPLVQLLLLGDQTTEALAVLDKACNESNSITPFRLKAHLWECCYSDESDKLQTYLEDVLKKDPACRYSMGRLVSLHEEGRYAPERLVEMIALHLEATYPDYKTWRKFASCLLKLPQDADDCASVCVDEDEVDSKQTYAVGFSRIPLMFVRGMSGKTWKLRSKWWLNRHFSKNILASEMSAGDLKLMMNKAACASHLYGKEFTYVTKVESYLTEHNKRLQSVLHLHIQNSIGFCSNY